MGRTYYVSTIGNNNNAGTINAPWATWQKAFSTADAGDTVYFRGGIYRPTTQFQGNHINLIEPEGYTPIGHSGTITEHISYFNYPGEIPILDCELIRPVGGYSTALMMYKVHYVDFKGLTFRNVYQIVEGVQAFGINMSACSNITVDKCIVNNISGNGIRFGSVIGYYGIEVDTFRFVNCDVYDCRDSLSSIPYNYADGWKGDGEAGSYLYFRGCRSWGCSDDGFDISGAAVKVFEKCWAFNTGLGIGVPDDGNGFKVGGFRDSISVPGVYMRNCISANNFRFAVHGLDYSPYYRNNARYYNNFFYLNEEGPWSFSNPAKPFINDVYKNNISYAQRKRAIGVIGYMYKESHNTWDIDKTSLSYWYKETDTVTVTDDDFISLDIKQLDDPRQSNGSLPIVTFGRLSGSSDLIGAGTNVGMSVTPDIGIDWAFSDEGADPIPVTSITVTGTGGATTITTDNGTLQMLESVFPTNATTKTCAWSCINGTGSAKISPSGLLEAVTNGTVTVKATANDDSGIYGTLVITISNQLIPANPVYVSSFIANATPSILEMTYSLTLANIAPAASAFTIMVNSVNRTISSISISGTRLLLTLSSPVVYGNVITVAYTKPATNPLQTVPGGHAATFSARSVLNNCIPFSNQPPNVSVFSPSDNSSFKAPGRIEITADASDIDGTIAKVEFFNGSIKLGEKTTAPYSLTWAFVPRGSYSIIAVATDNLNSKVESSPVKVSVRSRLRYTKGAPVISFLEPENGEHFVQSEKIVVTIDSYDPDTLISKVEYLIGDTRIGESQQPPYSISFDSPASGSYRITSNAYDELNEIVYSSSVDVYIDAGTGLINLYPNPNDGHFSIESLIPLQKRGDILNIINSTGQTVYQGIWENEENTRQFNLSHLDPGIYILIIKNQGILLTKKFIKN